MRTAPHHLHSAASPVDADIAVISEEILFVRNNDATARPPCDPCGLCAEFDECTVLSQAANSKQMHSRCPALIPISSRPAEPLRLGRPARVP